MPQVSSPGPADSCPVRFTSGGLASSRAGPSVPTFPPHPVWPPDRVLRSCQLSTLRTGQSRISDPGLGAVEPVFAASLPPASVPQFFSF